MTFLDLIKSNIKKSEYFIHKTKRSILIRFLLLVAILVSYFVFLSFKYGVNEGFLITILTWSFFVFCTPIADAGFLLDFPVRLITKIRMIYSEMFVWIIAFSINFYSIISNPNIYEKTAILKLFKHILLHPNPFWAIIIISAIGTFISIYFGDEMIDVVKHEHRKKYKKHKNKYRLILILFVIVITVLLYHHLLKKLGINILI
jgi:hypothetical protein